MTKSNASGEMYGWVFVCKRALEAVSHCPLNWKWLPLEIFFWAAVLSTQQRDFPLQPRSGDSPCILRSVLTLSAAGSWTPTRLSQENNFLSVSNVRRLDGSGTDKTADWEEHLTGSRLESETGETGRLLRSAGIKTRLTPILIRDPVWVSGRCVTISGLFHLCGWETKISC